WFSFLVHGRKDGRIPIPEGDHRCFIHLRLERLPHVSVRQLRDSLPQQCEHTRSMRAKIDCSLGDADPSALVDPNIAMDWALFGLSSEWVLQFVGSHRDCRGIPSPNVCQFFHYIENQLLVRTTGCC